MPNPIQVAKTFLEVTRGSDLGQPITSSDMFMVIDGREQMLFSLKTSALPMLKNEQVEYAMATGIKDVVASVTQTLNSIPITFLVRSKLDVVASVNNLLYGEENGNITARFYVGTKNKNDIKYYGTLKYCSIFAEEPIEADSEGTTTVASLSATIGGHFFDPDTDITKFENARASAIKLIKELTA